MSKLFATSLSVIVLTLGITAALAHQAGPGPQGAGSWGHMGQGWMGRQGWGPHMMGFGMMEPDMMLVMMDTNGDGALSLDEFQAMPTRMFKYLDANHDGTVTKDELDAFHADRDGNSGQ